MNGITISSKCELNVMMWWWNKSKRKYYREAKIRDENITVTVTFISIFLALSFSWSQRMIFTHGYVISFEHFVVWMHVLFLRVTYEKWCLSIGKDSLKRVELNIKQFYLGTLTLSLDIQFLFKYFLVLKFTRLHKVCDSDTVAVCRVSAKHATFSFVEIRLLWLLDATCDTNLEQFAISNWKVYFKKISSCRLFHFHFDFTKNHS